MEKKQEELDDLYSRFRVLMRLAMSGEKTVMLTDDLPEPVIHQFESIENRTCLAALQGYLASLELGPIYPFTLSLMFPKALLCGFIDFAYEILCYSEYFHKQIDVGNKTLFGVLPWRETEARIAFEEHIAKLKPIDELWYEIYINNNYSMFENIDEEEDEKIWAKYKSISEINKINYDNNTKILYDGLKSFMNNVVEKKHYEHFDLEFANTRTRFLVGLYIELREKGIVYD